MSANLNVLDPDNPKKILFLLANLGSNERTGWPVGF